MEFQPGAWTRLRLVLQGGRAAIFLGPGDRPAMVARLAREARPGFIALRAFLPPDTPGSGPVARIANVTVRPNVVPFDFSTIPVEAQAIPPGVVRRWAVSSRSRLPTRRRPLSRPPRQWGPSAPWTRGRRGCWSCTGS